MESFICLAFSRLRTRISGEFFELLYKHLPSSHGGDRVLWMPTMSWIFEVHSYYNALGVFTCHSFPRKRIWGARQSLFILFWWIAVVGKILTIDNLHKRHLLLVDWCCMCKRSGESIHHLPLHCSLQQIFDHLFLHCCGIVWVMPKSMFELMEC